MSTIHNRIVTSWTSQSGQLRADTQAIAGGMRNVGAGGRQGAQGLSLMSQQMRALGTTIRYAFAGVAVYGSMQLVRNLSQLQQQLGLMQALDSRGDIGKNIGQFTTDLLKGSIDAITPVQDLNNSVINLLSTVQNVPRDEVVDIVVRLSQAARLTQTDVTDLTQSITTMNNAFGQENNLRNIQKMTELWKQFIFAVPGGQAAGPQVIGQLAQTAAIGRGRISAPSMMGLFAALLRFGFKPSQAGPGFTRMLQTVLFPERNVKESVGALAEAGVTPDFVKSHGALAAVNRLIEHAKSLGVSGDINKILKAQKGAPDELVERGDIKDLPISGAGIQFLGRVFHRVQGLRAFIAILTRALAPPSERSHNLVQDLREFTGTFNRWADGMTDFTDDWKKFADRAQLAKAAQSLQALSFQVATGLEPIINPVARQVGRGAKFLTEHPGVTHPLSMAAAGLAGALFANRILGGGKPGGLLGRVLGRTRIPGLSFLNKMFGGQTALAAKAAEDMLQNIGNNQLGASPLNPLYVTVVGSLLPLGGMEHDKILGGGGVEQDAIDKVTKKMPRVFPFIASKAFWTRIGLPAVAGTGLGIANRFLAGSSVGQWKPFGKGGIFGLFGGGGGGGDINVGKNIAFDPRSRLWFEGNKMIPGANRQEMEINTARRLHTTFKAVRALENLANMPAIHKVLDDSNKKLVADIDKISARGMDINITIQQDGKKTTTKVHIPPTSMAYSGGRTPGSRGKKKTIKTAHIDLSRL